MTEGSTACSGSTLAFTKYLHDQGIRVIWAYQSDPSIVPSWAKGVRAGTARHRWLAASSRWWITDGLPMRVSGPDTVGRPLERGRDTRVLALVEPTVEKVGSDLVDWPLMTPRQQRLAQLRGETSVDLVASPTQASARALGFTAPVLEVSPLAELMPSRTQARQRLGLDTSAAVVTVISARGAEDEIARGLAGIPGLSVVISGDQPIDAVAAADALVTDTSPWAAVAARLGRPVMIVSQDLRDLLSRGPGLYVPWQRELPGPWAASPADVHEAVESLMNGAWAVPEQYASGHARLAALAGPAVDGACEQILATLQSDRVVGR